MISLSDRTLQIINAIGFQGVWWSVVFLKNGSLPLVALFIGINFYLHRHRSYEEWKWVFLVFLLGITGDSLLSGLGVIVFDTKSFLLPMWMIGLWLSFSCTLNSSLSWVFHGSFYKVGLIGAAGGASSYWAADRLEVLQISQPLIWSLSFIGLFWFLIFSVYGLLVSRFSARKLQG